MQENYLEDETVLTSYMHDMRAAREDADRELAHMRKMAEDAHRDWTRKLKDRRKEVSLTASALSASTSMLLSSAEFQHQSDFIVFSRSHRAAVLHVRSCNPPTEDALTQGRVGVTYHVYHSMYI